MILVYILSSSKVEAEEIAIDLLEKKLVYSINIISDVQSMRWENGKIVKVERHLVLAKTKALLYSDVEKEIKRVQTTGSVISFSMPLTQMSQDLFDNIQLSTLPN